MQEIDYLIVGAGAVGLAFADTIITESDATIAIVDRNPGPGGHWNDAYDFVRLHQPSALYGVNSVPLGQNRKDATGWNAGFYELATGAEVLDYFKTVMSEHLLPSGRVSFLPETEYVGDGRLKSVNSGDVQQVNVRRKIVDGTYYGTQVPATHKRKFTVDDGVEIIAPNALSAIRGSDANDYDRYCILGAGKTAMDVGVWLMENHVAGEQVSWVKPRDSWLMNRRTTQPGEEFFFDTVGTQAKQMLALAQASSVDDLFGRLEANGHMVRVYADVRPSMFHCATISEGEIALLQQIDHVIRKGRVTHVSKGNLELSGGMESMPERTLYIDCTAGAVAPNPAVPIYQDKLITLQMARSCQPTFSAALAAYVELICETDDEKNSLCSPLPLPDQVEDFIPFTLANMMNQYVWSRNKQLREWMLNSRLDGFSRMIADIPADDASKIDVLNAFRANTPSAIGNIQSLLAQSA